MGDQYDQLLDAGEDWLKRQFMSLRGTFRIGDSTISFGEPAIPVTWVLAGLIILVFVLAGQNR